MTTLEELKRKSAEVNELYQVIELAKKLYINEMKKSGYLKKETRVSSAKYCFELAVAFYEVASEFSEMNKDGSL